MTWQLTTIVCVNCVGIWATWIVYSIMAYNERIAEEND